MHSDITSLQNELAGIESLWNQAIAANDVKEIALYMTDDWVITGTEGGIISKAAFLEWISSGDLVHTKMDFEALLVQIHGNAAVVTAKGTSAGLYKGNPFSFYEWATSVYVKQNGRWVCVNTMITPAKGS